jgi:protein-disulfide isomerase-like protein with CxxC motif
LSFQPGNEDTMTDSKQGASGTVRARDAEQTAREQEGTKLHLLAAIRRTIEVNGLDDTAKMLREIEQEVGLPPGRRP